MSTYSRKPNDRNSHRPTSRGQRDRRPAANRTGIKLKSRVFVAPIGMMRDYWGRNMPRPIPPTLIRQALIDHLEQPDNLLFQSLQLIYEHPIKPSAIKKVQVKLFQEGKFQYIFQVTIDLETGQPVRLAMPVAKSGGKTSQTASLELKNLHALYHRDNRYVVRPLCGGPVPVPVVRGKSENHSIFVYFTTWLVGLHELGVDDGLHFFINEIPFHTFDRKVGDKLRYRILTILFSLYDPDRQRAMEPPQIASGDFVISRPKPNTPYELRLIACRKMVSKITLDQCLRLYLGYHGSWADKTFHLLPRDPQLLVNALREGLVEKNRGRLSWEQVIEALQRYAATLRGTAGQRSEAEWTPLGHLQKVISQYARIS